MTDTIMEQLYVPIGIFLPTTAPSVPLKFIFLSEDDDFDSRDLRCICEACYGAGAGCKCRGVRLPCNLCGIIIGIYNNNNSFIFIATKRGWICTKE